MLSAQDPEAVNPPVGLGKLTKENMDHELECLNNFDKKFKENGGDPGPVYDVVLLKNKGEP